jgi:hypothetical protein
VKPPWILERGATGLSEPDLHVFGKFFGDRLERRLEVKEPPIAGKPRSPQLGMKA